MGDAMNKSSMTPAEVREIAARLYDPALVRKGAGRPPGSLSLLAAALGVEKRTVVLWADEKNPNAPHEALAALMRAAARTAEALDMCGRPKGVLLVDRMAELILDARKGRKRASRE